MPKEIKPIETVYKGYRFRSRLEARWAIFMESLKLPFQYEPDGFDLGSGGYIPDFYVPGIGFIEIKGQEPLEAEVRKLSVVVRQTGDKGCIIVGAPGKYKCTRVFSEGVDEYHEWVDDGRTVEIAFQGNPDTERLRRAIERANSYRFEPGAKND